VRGWIASTLVASLTLLASGAAAQEKAPHPEPRVIIDVTMPKSSKAGAAVQAAARRGFWGKAVGCYRQSAKDAPALEIDATLTTNVRGGAVKKADFKKAKRGKRSRDTQKKADAVGRCLAKQIIGLEMPKDARGFFTLQVHIRPGDRAP
jgi:hypothetical protein